jgi:hypothetical protein
LADVANSRRARKAVDSSTLRNVPLLGVLHFKRSTETEEELGAFVARLRET